MSEAFNAIREGLEDAIAYGRGDTSHGQESHAQADRANVAAIRARLGMSQPAFAGAMAVSLSTLRKWEQGQRVPSGAARVLLRIMEKEPDAVRRVLEG
ncbi:helix-turn-helix domain-containing protein [Rhodospirillum sp. A1_3_36]|uniref:helix-turn-helix domain-containing protein n=1 Tax=Rhodospirillum sp. A1_3_36 TaxID=3391666 RepID=UPI0039A6A8B0